MSICTSIKIMNTKMVITLIGNSSIELLLVLQKGLINNILTTIYAAP